MPRSAPSRARTCGRAGERANARNLRLQKRRSGARRSVDCAANTGTRARGARGRNRQELARRGEHDHGGDDAITGRVARRRGVERSGSATGRGAACVARPGRHAVVEGEPRIERDLDVLHLRRRSERGRATRIAQRSARRRRLARQGQVGRRMQAHRRGRVRGQRGRRNKPHDREGREREERAQQPDPQQCARSLDPLGPKTQAEPFPGPG